MAGINRDLVVQLHADIMQKLGLSCRLVFDDRFKIGGHAFDDELGCVMHVNPAVEFQRPEHLILHEAAHHLTDSGHSVEWAETLCGIYRKTGYALPYSTGFENFAIAAGIKHKIFEQAGKTIALVMADGKL
jgi:hypothetical protein